MKNPTNVRLVRCPGCSEVLPEPVDVPFYRCGGCNTILQAKHYKKPNEVSKPVSESSGSLPNNQVQECGHGGEANSSNIPVRDQNEGLDPSSAQQLGISNSSREASSSSQPTQQELSSSSRHSLDLDEETDQILEATDLLTKGSSLNEPSPPNHQVPPNLVPETGEVELNPRYTEHRDSGASSSGKQLPQITPENTEVKQDEIVVEEKLEAADSSSEAADSSSEAADSNSEAASPEATTAKTYRDAHELNQNMSRNCRLEQPRTSSFSIEPLSSNEPSLHETNHSSPVALEEEQIDGSNTQVKENLEVSNSISESILSIEPSIDGDALCEVEISSTNEPASILNINDSSQSITTNREAEADNVDDFCVTDENVYSHVVTSSNQSTPVENIEFSRLVTETEQMDGESIVQNQSGISNEDKLPSKIVSLAGVSSKMTDGSAFVLPEAENLSGSNLSSKSDVSNAPDEKGDPEAEHSVDGDAPADGNCSDLALLNSKVTIGAEVLNLDDGSQKTLEENTGEQIEELQKASPNGFESVETREVVDDAHIGVPELSTSDKGLPKSPARNSFAYDGSVSSYDGADDQVKYKIRSETAQEIYKPESPNAEDQREYLPKRSVAYSGRQAASVGKDRNSHSEEQRTPVMLNEIKMPEVLSDSPYRRNRPRPRTREFLPVPQHRRSPETVYESSDHPVHKDFYDRPGYYPPYQYRDVESRISGRHLRRNDVDGRMVSEAYWMGEEFRMHPYHESSSEIYPYPRHQMYYHGRRQAEYQPLGHSMARVPYSEETVRRGYRVLDSYSRLYSGEMRWSSQFPSPALSYNRGWSGPREPFDSYNASPRVFADSEYYAWGHDAISEDQRHSGQRMSRVQVRRNAQPARHLQPIGGAAPFITCYQCSTLVELPSDFLPFKGMRIHRVKCSACSNILKFTLEKGLHLVPYVPNPATPLGEYAERGFADKLMKSALTSQATHAYEASHRRSASNSSYGGSSQAQSAERVSLRSSSQAPERQRSNFESNHSQDKGKSVMMEMHKQSSTSGNAPPDIPRHPKVTWKVPDRSSSPLHRLMGYSSPSAVLYGYGSPDGSEI